MQRAVRRAVHAGGIALLLLLAACSGAEPSSLLLAPPAATVSEPSSSSVPTRDAGEVTAAIDSGKTGTQTPSDDAGDVTALASPDAGGDEPADDAGEDAAYVGDADLEDAADAADGTDTASTLSCPLAGEAAAAVDDGSWPGANATILPQCGRMGTWYAMNDGTTTQSPLAGAPFGPFLTDAPPSTAKGYVRTWGTLAPVSTQTHGDPHWGAEIGFDLDAADGSPRPYDLTASGYHGLTFWIRTGTTNALTPIWFDVPTSQTISYSDGAFHSFSFAAPAPGVWTEVTVPFTSLTQPSWTPAGERVAFDPTAAISLQWNFDSAATQSLAFDVSIGDVQLW